MTFCQKQIKIELFISTDIFECCKIKILGSKLTTNGSAFVLQMKWVLKMKVLLYVISTLFQQVSLFFQSFCDVLSLWLLLSTA